MSDIKMSDYFALPSNNLVYKINSNKTIKANCDGVSEFDAIDLAINSHDKLTEQNKLLREALEQILYNHRLVGFDIESVAEKTLEATK